MNRALAVLGTSLSITILAGSSLMASPTSSHGPACEAEWWVVATGDCPPDVVEWCNDALPDECEAADEGTICNESQGGGHAIYCETTS